MANQALFGAIAKHFPKGVIMVFDKDCRFVHLEGEELDRMGLSEWDFFNQHILRAPVMDVAQLQNLQRRILSTLQGQHLSFELQQGANTYAVNSTPLQVREAPGWALLSVPQTGRTFPMRRFRGSPCRRWRGTPVPCAWPIRWR